MSMKQENKKPEDFAIIEKAIMWLVDRYPEQVSPNDLAEWLGMTPFALQKMLSRWAGVSPKKFIQYLTLAHAKKCLAEKGGGMANVYNAELSERGRQYDLFVSVKTMTSGEWKKAHKNLLICYGWHSSPFGDCLIAVTDRAVCGLAFALAHGRSATQEILFRPWNTACIIENSKVTGPFAECVFYDGGEVSVVLRGTPFQLQVWEALLRIPPKKLVSYGGLATTIDKPGSARAVASAVARNPVSWLVPCHRVIQKTGSISGYRWGPSRKRAILAWEACKGGASIRSVGVHPMR